MNTAGKRLTGLLAMAVLAGAGFAGAQVRQTAAPGATTAPAAATHAAPAAAATSEAAAAPTASTAPAAKKPTVDELLPKDAAELKFDNVPMKDVLQEMGDKFGFKVVNAFDFTTTIYKKDDNTTTEEPQRMTLTTKLTARQAINVMAGSLNVIGYQIAENVAGDPPQVVLTVYQGQGRDTPRIKVFYGSNADEIPEGDEVRTQVMTLAHVKPSDAKDDLEALLGKTDISVDNQSGQLTITDTGSKVKIAARAVQLMEKKAGNK